MAFAISIQFNFNDCPSQSAETRAQRLRRSLHRGSIAAIALARFKYNVKAAARRSIAESSGGGGGTTDIIKKGERTGKEVGTRHEGR